MKDTWKNINDIINPSSHAKYQTEFILDNHIIAKPQDIVNHFNSFVTTIGSDLAFKIPSVSETIYDFLGPPINHSVDFFPTDTAELTRTIAELKHASSPSPDEIPPAVIKAAAPLIVGALAHIINSTLATGIFPTKLKHAKVTPVYKSGDHK